MAWHQQPPPVPGAWHQNDAGADATLIWHVTPLKWHVTSPNMAERGGGGADAARRARGGERRPRQADLPPLHYQPGHRHPLLRQGEDCHAPP
eukprot:7246857-Prymnesium_polylepis.1